MLAKNPLGSNQYGIRIAPVNMTAEQLAATQKVRGYTWIREEVEGPCVECRTLGRRHRYVNPPPMAGFPLGSIRPESWPLAPAKRCPDCSESWWKAHGGAA